MTAGGMYRDIVERSPDGIWVIDLTGRTIYANPAMARLYGVPHERMQDVPMQASLDEVGRTQLEEHLGRVREGHVNHDAVEVQLVRHDGGITWVLVRECPVHDEAGRAVALQLTFSDYNERRAAVLAHEESRRRLEEAQEIARIGAWTWDLTAGEIIGSAQVDRLFDVDTTTGAWTLDRFVEKVHPDDRDRVRELVAASLADGSVLDFTVQVRVGEEWRWVRSRGVLQPDPEHPRMVGTLQDVTETKQTEIALADQAAQNTLMQTVSTAANDAEDFEGLLRQARDLVLLHDDWARARAFTVDHDEVLHPLYVDPRSAAEDDADPATAEAELALARKVLAGREVLWDDARLTIAFPVMVLDEVRAVLTITSDPPLYRHAMIEQMVAHVAEQMGRVAWRERVREELAEARDQAMDASRQKSEFLATMSHEIRTPLNGVIGLNDLLMRTTLTGEQQRLAAGVQVASRALLGVINDILDFSKIEAGRLEVEVLDFEVRPVLDQVVGVLAAQARAKGVELTLSCAADVPRVLAGDPTRIAQVLTNLVSNAVKFTDRGHVDVEATARPAHDGGATLVVSVTDTGIGVPPDKVAGLFDPFTQADASTTRVYGGTGLGLAISHEIVQALGGTLGHRPNPAGGAVFTAEIPLALPDGDVVDAADEQARSLLGGRRVLVVDDNPANRMILVEQLGWWGLEVDVAASVDEALAAVARNDRDATEQQVAAYAAVLLDMAMPERDGLDLARTLRADPAHRSTVLLMLTSMNHLTGAEVRRAGLDDCLVKPVLSGVLRSVLVEHLTTTQPASAPAATRGRHRVLVVEDNPVNQMVASGLLEHLGYDHATVDDGQAAVEAVARGGWDAVLMDVQMPVLDGYAATRAIRAAEAAAGSPRLPVIAMTAAAVEGERERCADAGMDDYLTKPVDPAALTDTLARWLDASEHDDGPGHQPGDQSGPAPCPERDHEENQMTEPVPPTDDPALAGLDLARLEMLRELDEDNTDYLDRAIANFGRNCTEAMAAMGAAIEAGDADALRQSSHKLAGGALNLGVVYAGEAVRRLEAVADTGSVDGAAELLPSTQEALERGQAALAAYQEWYRGLGG